MIKAILEYFNKLWYNLLRIGEVKVMDMEKNNKISILTVANYVIYYLNQKGQKISQLKLQKLLYFIEAYNMACGNPPMFSEQFKAYTYGPLCFEVYDYYKIYGGEDILEYDDIDDATKETLKPYTEIIDAVCDTFGDLTAAQLVNLTHEEDSPWSKIWQQNGGKNSSDLGIIPKDLTCEWFRERFTDAA